MTTTNATYLQPLSQDMEKYMDLNIPEYSESVSQSTENTDCPYLREKDFEKEQQQQQEEEEEQEQPQQQHENHEITLPKSQPCKILPPTLLLASQNEIDSNVPLTETKINNKTLLEMGFKANDVKDWENILQLRKQNLYALLRYMIEQHIKPNVQIRIGNISFNCHMIVLQSYAEFFLECDNEILIHLPEERITPSAFAMVYDWMLADEPLIQREGILDLFNAASFLRVKELVNQCWLCFDDYARFCEDSAFLLYWEARKYNLESLEQLMLTRICKFFLTLVASQEFLLLTAKEIIILFNSNSIGVNSEIEIFMSAVRWLDYDWEKREQYVLDILKSVRFNLIPPWFLVTLTQETDCIEIDRILVFPEIKKLISDAITYSTTKLYYGRNRRQFYTFVKRYNLDIPMQREWIFDKECKYHHRLDCPNMQYFTYRTFLEYLKHIQEIGKDYWCNLEMANRLEAGDEPCTCSNEHKTSVVNFRVLPRKKSCDQGIQCENVTTSYRKNMLNARLQNKRYSNTKNVFKCATRGHLRPIASPRSTKSILATNNYKSDGGQTVRNTSLQEQQKHPEEKERNSQKIETQNYDFKYQCKIEQSETVVHNIRNHNSNSTDNNNNHENDKNDKERLQEQQQQQQQRPQSLQHNHQYHRSQQQAKQHQTKQCDNRNLKIYKIYPENTVHNTTTVDSNLSDDILNLNKYAENDCGIDINVESFDFNSLHEKGKTEVQAEVKTVMKEEIVQNVTATNRNKKMPPNVQQQVPEYLNSRPECKIIVIGGIDPYCMHCQYEKERQKVKQRHQQPHQQHHLHYPTQRQQNHNILIPTIANNMAYSSSSPINPTSSITYNNKWQQFGDQVLLYDFGEANTTWRHLSQIPLGSRHHHAAVLCNDLIYVIGGCKTEFVCTKKSIFEKSVWCFNPKTLKWIFECSLPESRRDFAVIPIHEKTKCLQCKDRGMNDAGFFIIGGEGLNRETLNTVWFYSVERKIWLKKAPLNIGRYGLTAAKVNNEIWIAGGMINNNNNCGDIGTASGDVVRQTITDTIEIYNLKCPHTYMKHNKNEELNYGPNYAACMSSPDQGAGDCYIQQWIKSNLRLREPRLFGKLCKMPNDDLYIIGGISFNKLGKLTSLAAIDHFNFEQHEWRHVANLKFPRHGHDVAVINDSCIAVVGGVSTTKTCSLKTVEVFCTKTHKSLKDLTELPLPLSGCAVVTLT